MSRNRRKHPRVRARGVAAHLRTEQGRTPCVVENVSMGGLFVRTDRLAEVGTELFVDLVRPGWKKQLTVAARISSRVDALNGRLSQRPPGMGMQFLRLDDKQHDRLRQLLRELGAPDEPYEVTLPDESAEPELRALSTEPEPPIELRPDPTPPAPLWQQVQPVEAAIEVALREANLPPPGPVELDPEPPRRPAPSASPQKDADAARLMVQIRGLVMQLGEAQQLLTERDLEIQRLKDELDTIRSALERSVRKN